MPQIPRLAETLKAIVYSPLADAPVEPDVVLFRLKPEAAMLLEEAAGRAGVGVGAPSLGRPTCMALPASLQFGAIASLGCIENRVYTGLDEEEICGAEGQRSGECCRGPAHDQRSECGTAELCAGAAKAVLAFRV